MRTRSRFIRIVGVLGLLISGIATTAAPAAAQQDAPGSPAMDYVYESTTPGFRTGLNTLYYPWVANDDDFGLGDADTSITIQNLEDRDGQIWIYVGAGDGNWVLAETTYLARYASKTFTAAQLGIASGDGAPVAVSAFHRVEYGVPGTAGWTLPPNVPAEALQGLPANAVALVETPAVLSRPAGVTGGSSQVVVCVVNYKTTAQPQLGVPHGYVDAITGDWETFDTQTDLQAALNAVNPGPEGRLINPFGGLNDDGDCFDVLERETTNGVVSFLDSLAIGGVAKQAVEGEALPFTGTTDVAVSGYNALNGAEVFNFAEWYLPIVQTNGEPGGRWNSILRIANVTNTNNAVTVRFFPADDGSGSLQTGFQLQQLVDGGDTWHIDLSDHVPAGWVGSAHIFSDGAAFAMVDRYKVGYSMWITNTGSSADFENEYQGDGAGGRYALFAPHVLLDYFGWNTGINVANLVNQDNNVSVQYFNLLGNATEVLNQRLAPHGMTYFYDPSNPAENGSSQDPVTDKNAGVVGSAIIWSDHPVAVAVDETKYPESDPQGGVELFQATSYSATQNLYTWQAVPLVQKGNPATGMGPTSGINIMNPNTRSATVKAHWINPSGFEADNAGVSSVTIPAFANGFIYTMTQKNLPNGFYGAAQLIANVPVVAVSANVDYQVDGDGSAIFNAYNPCGFFRVQAECSFGPPFSDTGGSVTKFFEDDLGRPVAGVQFHIIGNNPDFPYQRNGTSGPDGSLTFTNVPLGQYTLHVDVVPPAYVMPDDPADTFTLTAGEDEVILNVLERRQFTVTKTVVLSGTETTLTPTPLAGINVAIYTMIGATSTGDPVIVDLDDPDFTGLTNASGQVGVQLYPGIYVLCMYDANGTATIPGGATIEVDLPDEIDLDDDYCDVFAVIGGSFTMQNTVDQLMGQIDIGADLTDFTEHPGFTACLYAAGTTVEDDDPVACVTDIPADVMVGDDAGGFFAVIPSGSYFIYATDGGLLEATTNVLNYSVPLDGRDGLLADITDVPDDADGYGFLDDDGEWDWLITSFDGTMILGPGQTDD